MNAVSTPLLSLIDRAVYPADRFPVGPWDYVYYYQENFDRAVAVLGADPYSTVKAFFRRGNPASVGRPGSTASMRASGGWFGGRDAAPELPADTAIATDEELRIYAESIERSGFFGPVSLYMNDQANARYAAQALDGGRLTLPVLFIAGRYENVCEAVRSPLAGRCASCASTFRRWPSTPGTGSGRNVILCHGDEERPVDLRERSKRRLDHEITQPATSSERPTATQYQRMRPPVPRGSSAESSRSTHAALRCGRRAVRRA